MGRCQLLIVLVRALRLSKRLDQEHLDALQGKRRIFHKRISTIPVENPAFRTLTVKGATFSMALAIAAGDGSKLRCRTPPGMAASALTLSEAPRAWLATSTVPSIKSLTDSATSAQGTSVTSFQVRPALAMAKSLPTLHSRHSSHPLPFMSFNEPSRASAQEEQPQRWTSLCHTDKICRLISAFYSLSHHPGPIVEGRHIRCFSVTRSQQSLRGK
jgi:hypothetical protein